MCIRDRFDIEPEKIYLGGTKSEEATFAAMEQFAKQQAIDFDKWKWENRWFSFENGYWYQTHEQGTAMSQATYNKHHRKTPEQLYNQFIESQNKNNGSRIIP